MKTKIYNITGKSVGDIDLPEVFDTKVNEQLLAQYIRVYLANQRQGTRKTKGRSEVKGKAGKPYRQKGTGRARHGSMKAPSMRGGGISHGPRPQNFSLKMSKIMKANALKSAFANKKDSVLVLDSAKLDEVKTKSVANFLDAVEAFGRVVIVTKDLEKNLVNSSRNIPGVKIAKSNQVNAYDVMCAEKVIFERSVLEDLNK